MKRITKCLFFLAFITLTVNNVYAQPDLYPQITSAVNFDNTTSIASFNLYIQNGTPNYPTIDFEVAYYVSTDAVYDNNDTHFSSLTITPSMMGGDYCPTSVGCKLTVPGNWYILVVVDKNDSIQEQNESNNIASSSMITVAGTGGGIGGGTSGGPNDVKESQSGNLVLAQIYPNPCSNTMGVKFSLTKEAFTTLKIYDITGKEVNMLMNQSLPQGTHEYEFDSSNLPSGIYYYTLVADNEVQTRKFIKDK